MKTLEKISIYILNLKHIGKAFIAVTLYFISIACFTQNVHNPLKIATFNIQDFGKSKLSKTNITDTLATIIRNFDIVAIQEISDRTNHTAFSFLRIINHDTLSHYKLACSRRTGLQPKNKSSQEQYAFYYNSDVITLMDTTLYDDSGNDYFQREPYIASFKTVQGNLSFILCTVHTSPRFAVKEISSLIYVAQWLSKRFTKNDNIIFCGDFNASCNYASPGQLSGLSIHNKPYNWIIPDTAKTNLSKNKNCAYDRFIVTDSLYPKVARWSVLHYFKSKAVSDHWPVYIELKY